MRISRSNPFVFFVGALLFLAAPFLRTFAADEVPAPLTDGEVWNAGVDFFRGGDYTNALRVLRPLMLSKTHGPRAAELVSVMEHERGNREEAASASQIALRSNPGDARLQRNFTRASDGLREFRETGRVESVLKASEGKDPGSMLMGAVKEVRRLMKEAGTYRTNSAEKVVAASDRLSKSADSLADVWIPLRQTIVQSVTNEEQASTIMLQIEKAQEKTKKAAKELSDIDPSAYSTIADVEHDFTRFAKLTAMPPAAIAEDLVSQSNAWMDVELFNGREWQRDALDFTRSFRANFPAWAKAYEQQSQADTNKPPFTAEDQAKISALATELEKLQIECCEKDLPPKQEKALELIRQIQNLLPKDSNGGGGQGQNQQNPQNQGQDNKQENKKDEDSQQPQSQPQEKQQENQNKDEKDEQPESAEEEREEEDQELEAVLKKAQERNDEHEAEKKARMRKSPLPPNERDW